MADVTWTEEQLAAITARNPGVLVSAGAGSGKTAVLTERVVQRIFDPVDPVDADRMLIVTFTRAAAEEMRERIAVKLRAVQQEHPEDSSVARQLILLEKADISTVHAFCWIFRAASALPMKRSWKSGAPKPPERSSRRDMPPGRRVFFRWWSCSRRSAATAG